MLRDRRILSLLAFVPCALAGCAARQPTPAAAPLQAGPCDGALQKARVLSLGTFPDYPAEARRLHATGTVVVTLSVSATGRVTGARFEQLAGSGLDEAVLASARTIRFAPATSTASRK